MVADWDAIENAEHVSDIHPKRFKEKEIEVKTKNSKFVFLLLKEFFGNLAPTGIETVLLVDEPRVTLSLTMFMRRTKQKRQKRTKSNSSAA